MDVWRESPRADFGTFTSQTPTYMHQVQMHPSLLLSRREQENGRGDLETARVVKQHGQIAKLVLCTASGLEVTSTA